MSTGQEKNPVNCTHLDGWCGGRSIGRGPKGAGEGVTGCALSIGATPRVRAVPGAELQHLENV